MSVSDPDSGADTKWRAKQLETWPLVPASVTLMGCALSCSVLYVVFGVTTEVRTMLVGAPILVLGFVLLLVGLRRRLREIRSADEPSTRGYRFVLLGSACVVVGLTLPWYLVA